MPSIKRLVYAKSSGHSIDDKMMNMIKIFQNFKQGEDFNFNKWKKEESPKLTPIRNRDTTRYR